MNEKFLEYYIDELIGVANRLTVANAQLSAHKRVSEELLQQMVAKDEAIHRLTDEKGKLEAVVAQFEQEKVKLQHFDTFQNEVIRLTSELEKAREELQTYKSKEVGQYVAKSTRVYPEQDGGTF